MPEIRYEMRHEDGQDIWAFMSEHPESGEIYEIGCRKRSEEPRAQDFEMARLAMMRGFACRLEDVWHASGE